MFCALAEFFLFLLHLTNVNTGLGLLRCGGAGWAAAHAGSCAREGGSWASCCALLGQKEMEPTQAKGKAFFFLFKKGLNQSFQHIYKQKFDLLIWGYFKNCFLSYFWKQNIFS